MKKLVAIAVAALALCAAACGKQPPPQAPAPAPAPKVNQAPATNVHAIKHRPPEDTKQGFYTEYREQRDLAFEAKKEYDAVRRDRSAAGDALNEPYVKWAIAVYDALRIAELHQKAGHDKERLPRLRELMQLRSDLTKALGPNEDPRVKKAQAAFQKVVEGN